ncbi:MAG: hypothetical protein GWN29_05240, partial [Gammaproteobacteria bacterium]|nr:hypothetical protein [Gammaproteobacteria bacterium]
NEVRDEIRSAARRPWKVEVPEDLAAHEPTPLAELLTTETFEMYQAALDHLPMRTAEAVILRL